MREVWGTGTALADGAVPGCCTWTSVSASWEEERTGTPVVGLGWSFNGEAEGRTLRGE
jgi:hypothetical protein